MTLTLGVINHHVLIYLTACTDFHLTGFNSFLEIYSLSIFPYKNKRDQILPCCKISQGQPRVIIGTYLVVLKQPMPHTKFQRHRPFGSRKDFYRFYHIWAWRPSWSCDINHLYSLSFPHPMEAPHKIGFNRRSAF